jgi:hypothetical protein
MTGIKWAAAAAMTFLPVSTPPVRKNQVRFGVNQLLADLAVSDGQRMTASFGNPARWK